MAGNKISNILFQNKKRYITHKIKRIAFIASVVIMSLHGNALATQSQCLQIKSKLCKSYREFGIIKKDPEFIEMGFAPASKYHSLLQKFQEDSKKYDSALNMEAYR